MIGDISKLLDRPKRVNWVDICKQVIFADVSISMSIQFRQMIKTDNYAINDGQGSALFPYRFNHDPLQTRILYSISFSSCI